MERILVVDDEEVLRRNIVRFLVARGHLVDEAESAEEALERCGEAAYAVVVTDLRLPDQSGLDLLERLATEQPSAQTLLMTAYASVDTAVRAMRSGAADYVLKPLQLDDLARRVDTLLQTARLREEVQRMRRELRDRSGGDLVARSVAMQLVTERIARVADTRVNVLIRGESGTGKELVARALHEGSAAASKPFVAVNLAAQPAELVDATLFGHVRGAFTGASVSRDGVFRAARGGTVFLDEIGELPLAVQAKLLRVIENRDVLPLGADRAVPTDFRLVAATHQPLEKRVEEGTFRQDLLFRLDVVRIDVPPLRERLADLPELAERLLERHARSLGRPTPRLSTAALAALRAYRWPGNVRELSNLLERSALFATGPWIDEAELPAGLAASGGDGLRLREAVQRFEQQHVRHVLALHGGDKRAAAETLGVHLATLYRHLERVGDDEKDP